MAAMEENREADARMFWSEAYARMAPDDPRRDMARQMSANTRGGG
jgi:cytochrome c-type biogenesis protein CcmH